jgi:transposase
MTLIVRIQHKGKAEPPIAVRRPAGFTLCSRGSINRLGRQSRQNVGNTHLIVKSSRLEELFKSKPLRSVNTCYVLIWPPYSPDLSPAEHSTC